MGNIKISILIPICNVEKYLEKCLNSIINQSLYDIQIICINDGSKDSSLDIIRKFEDRDKRIVVIDKPNSGYGDSMNKGLEIATGDYIGIVESDDFIEPKMFEELYALAIEYNADIVKSNFNMYWEFPERKVYFNNLKIEGKIYDTELAREKVFWGVPAIWSAIYRRSWLIDKQIKFLSTPGASYQDTSFHFKTTCTAEKIIVSNKSYLNYRQDNENSSVKNASMEKVHLLHKEWDEVENYLNKKHLMSKYEKYYTTLRFNAFMWNYNRISEYDKKGYFNEVTDSFKNNSLALDDNHIPRYCKYGGCFAIKYKNKYLFDLILWLTKIKNRK